MKYIFLVLLFYANLAAHPKLFCAGSTTIQPLLQEVSKKYREGKEIDLVVQGGGSTFGLDMVKLDKADIGMVSRELTSNEKEEFSYATIGYDSLAIVVNAQNPLQNISTKELVQIYKGDLVNWKSLNANDEEIVAVSKKAGRGTMTNFENYTKLFHPKNPINKDSSKMLSDRVLESGSNNDTIVLVGGIPNSIGFVSYGAALSFIKLKMPIKILNLDGVELNLENLKNNKYPIIRPLNIVYNRENIEAKRFADWLVKEYTQSVVEKFFFIKIEK